MFFEVLSEVKNQHSSVFMVVTRKWIGTHAGSELYEIWHSRLSNIPEFRPLHISQNPI
jgi:hypothetical protein